MCMIEDADECFTISRAHQVKSARKPHKCCECGRQIEVGESYHYAFGVFDKQASEYHICVHCQVATAWLTENCNGWLYHGVYEDIEQHIDGTGGLCLGLRRLKKGMERKWQWKDGTMMRVPPAPANYPEDHQNEKE